MTSSTRPSGRTRSACAPSPIIRPRNFCARKAWISSASTSICTSEQPFENYLARLQMLAESKPLLLGEFGMDSLREGEARQV